MRNRMERESIEKKKKILITGATGNVGAEVIKILKQQGIPFIAAVRNIQKAQGLLGEEIEYIPFDFLDPATYRPALEAIDKIFLVRPPDLIDVNKQLKPFLDVAKSLGIKQIVFLSLLGVEKNKIVPHAKIEEAILKAGIAYTFLRAGFFMQNLNTTHQQDIKENNDVFIPAGRGKTSFIDVRDIAEVGVHALRDVTHLNKAYPLTGSVALDYYEIAEVLSQGLGRKIVYSNPSILRFYWTMRRRGLPRGYILVMIAIYTTTKFGRAKTITKDIEDVLGRPPITIRKYVDDYKASW